MKYRIFKELFQAAWVSKKSKPQSGRQSVIGKKQKIKLIFKNLENRRHLLMIGAPGTGKSYIIKQYLKTAKKIWRPSIYAIKNSLNPTNPKILVGNKPTIKPINPFKLVNIIKYLTRLIVALNFISITGKFIFSSVLIYKSIEKITLHHIFLDLITNAFKFFTDLAGNMGLIALVFGWAHIELRFLNFKLDTKSYNYKLLVNPGFGSFVDATGATYSALFGHVRHDPLGRTESEEQYLEVGMVHNANNGVLFIDQIGTLNSQIQYYLLQTMENKASIIGLSSALSQNSNSGIRSEPIPCNFSMICAGNQETIARLHPALISRFNAYGLIVYMDDCYQINEAHVCQYIKFINQELKKNKLKEMSRVSYLAFCHIAQVMTGQIGYLTLKLRKMAGILICASDITESHAIRPMDIYKAYILKLPIETLRKIQLDLRIIPDTHVKVEMNQLKISPNTKGTTVFEIADGKINYAINLAIALRHLANYEGYIVWQGISIPESFRRCTIKNAN